MVSLTPLIDVVFILLVFFMLVSSFADWRTITVAPPIAGSGQNHGFTGAVLVEVQGKGQLRLSGEILSIDDIVGRLERMLNSSPDLRFIIKAKDGIPLQDLVDALDRLSEAGVEDMIFARTKGAA